MEEELMKIIPFYKTPVNYFDFPQIVKLCVHIRRFGFFLSILSNFFHNYFTPRTAGTTNLYKYAPSLKWGWLAPELGFPVAPSPQTGGK